MPLRIEDKKAIVAEVTEAAKSAMAAVAANYRGLTVTEMTQLRKDARSSGVYLKIVRNTLAKRALADTDFKCMDEILVGPVVLAFSQQEPSAPARLMRDFIKSNEKLAVKGLALSGRLLDAKELDAVAKLPTREEALATLMATLKAPITKFVRTLAEPHAKLVRVIAAIRDKKQAA